MKALILITTTGSMLAYSLFGCSQIAKYDLFFHAYHKVVPAKKYCCNQSRGTCTLAAKKAVKA